MRNDASPCYSVVIPAPSLHPKPALLADLEALTRVSLELLIATGSNPSRQRNLAVTHACGDWLVFLDSDCRLEGSYLDRIAAHAERGAEVVGGPVLLREPATPLEIMFQGLLGHPLLTGASSSRYRSKGALRKCDDAELILCNLAVRRDLFLKSTGFAERLYPNEENEWLARLRAQGVDLWHDPDLVVRRPQRKSWPAYVRMLTGYGRGRTRQFRVSGRWDFARQLPAVVFLAWLALFVLKPRVAIKASLLTWLGAAGTCKVFSGGSGAQHFSTATALVAPSVPLLYAVGQVMEFFNRQAPNSTGKVQVYRWQRPPNALSSLLRPGSRFEKIGGS
ncbi:MAG TPA: glycosyltransferase [Terrimicrobiaceae bacterium]